MSHVLAQILVRRGLADPARRAEFLAAPRHDPSQFAGIERALALIRAHIAAGDRIVDPRRLRRRWDLRDRDHGPCAARARRRRPAGFCPSRLEDGYGLAASTVERLAARETALIVTVDCAITAVDEVAAARAAGLDVVITDHHSPRPDGSLPDCPLVHPAVCGYPFPGLCGTAVAYKLAQALGADSAEDDLELVALATVADLVPLQDENRRLVREGLAALANTAKPGLRALMAVSRADPSALELPATLGFRLAPADQRRRAPAPTRRRTRAAADRRRAASRRDRGRARAGQRRAPRSRAADRLGGRGARSRELGPRSAYVLASDGWHPGVVGIVASRIVDRHHRPAVLIGLDGEPGTGSGRGNPGFDLLGALHDCAPALHRYGGHRAAAGLTVARERLPELRAAFEDHAERVLTPELLEPVQRVDAIVSGAELGLPLAEELERLEPCGMANPSPRLLVPGARFTDVRPMGEGRHARFSVSSGGVSARAVAFGCERQLPGDQSQPRDATFKLERNAHYNGAVEPRLVLRHEQPCAPAADRGARRARTTTSAARAQPSSSARRRSDPGRRLRRRRRPARHVIDRRGESPLSVLADATSAGGAVLAVCADVPRRLAGLRARSRRLRARLPPDARRCARRSRAPYEHLVGARSPAVRRARLPSAGDGLHPSGLGRA